MAPETCRICGLELELNPFTNKYEADTEHPYICSYEDQGIRERFHQPKNFQEPTQQSPDDRQRIASGACRSYQERFGRREVPGVSENHEIESMPFL